MTDIESLKNELQDLLQEEAPIEEIAAHVQRLCADAELRALVAARDCSYQGGFGDTIGSIRGRLSCLISAHEEKQPPPKPKPKCEHPAEKVRLWSDGTGEESHWECDCGKRASVKRPEPSDWKEPGK